MSDATFIDATADRAALGAGSQLRPANDAPAGAGAPAAAGEGLLFVVTPASVKEVLQSAGYRVEILEESGITVVRSATSGLPFDVRLGNGLPGPEVTHLDMTFVALFAVQGAFPEKLLNEWNRSRRFGRLFLDQPVPGQDFLVLALDVTLAGGVTARHLRAHIEIWDALVQQLVAWLRQALPAVAATVVKESGSPQPQPQPQTAEMPALVD